jgi:cytochrome c oxidase subunit 1
MYGSAQILFLFNVIRTIGWGKPTDDPKVWEGAEGLEWTVPTPAPYHTFATPPEVK